MRYGPLSVRALSIGVRLMNLEDLWCVEYDLIEEGYMHFAESRNIDLGQDLLQIFAGALEKNYG